MTGPSADWDKLGRYLAGESSPDEVAEVRRWLETHPSDARVIAALEAATKQVTPERIVDVEAALRLVKSRPASSTPTSPSRFARYSMRVETIAAAAAILLVAGVLLFRRTETVRPPTAEVTFSTGIGQRDSVRLEDGSTVLLGPASRIVVRDRYVELSGEAYFKVVHNDARPFTVRAGNATIRDIGTEFSVHSDASEPVKVVVREGAVELTYASDSVTLRPGDIGVVARSGRVEASRGAATADDLAWTRGQLVFRDAPVGDMAEDLRRWYGVELRVTDSSLLRRHFTGSFVAESRDTVLEVIALALGARVERRGDTAYIKPKTSSK